ncbi:erythromycin resistance leader peptide [Bacillus sp. 1NLA3E]
MTHFMRLRFQTLNS